MNRRLILLALYECDPVPLDCQRFDLTAFGYRSYREAAIACNRGTFPVPVFRASESQKSKWCVSISALADYWDAREREAREKAEGVRRDILEGMR